MRYVNCARYASEQNLAAFQYKGNIYYKSIRNIPPYSELLVFYGFDYAEKLGINRDTFYNPDIKIFKGNFFFVRYSQLSEDLLHFLSSLLPTFSLQVGPFTTLFDSFILSLWGKLPLFQNTQRNHHSIVQYLLLKLFLYLHHPVANLETLLQKYSANLFP